MLGITCRKEGKNANRKEPLPSERSERGSPEGEKI